MIGATVTDPDGNTRPVKNLGWILRNWKRIDRFEVTHYPPDGKSCPPDAWLVAYTRDGYVYRTPYADRGVLAGFIDRPVFRGLPILWYGEARTVGEKLN